MPDKTEEAKFGVTNVTDFVNSENAVGAVEGFIQLMNPLIEPYRKQWLLNIANYLGNQNMFIDQVGGRLITPMAPSWRVRLVINKILPIARTIIAKLTDFNPRMYVSPRTNDEADRKGARIGSKVAESIRQSTDFTTVRRELGSWVVLCGNGYILTAYDENTGKKMVDFKKDEKGDNILGGDGKPEKIEFKTGDILIEDVSPFEIIPDLSTFSWRDQAAMVRRKVRSLDYIARKYSKDVEAENISEDYFQQLRIMSMATNSGRSSNTRRALEKSAMVKEMWAAPSDKFPKGRHIIIANKVLLFEGDLSTSIHGKPAIPVTHIGAIQIPGRLMFMSPIENILDPQWHYNRGRSQIIENINQIGKPKVFAAEDSIPQGAYTDEPGEIIEVNMASGHMPVVVPPPPIPNYHLENLKMLLQEMEDIAGIHEISLGRLPRRATSGVALSILEEKDNTIIAPMKESMSDGYRRSFSLALNIASKKFKERRISKIAGGPNSDDEFINWLGIDLASQDDVRVVTETSFPSSRPAKMEFVINLKKNGIINSEQALMILNLTDMNQVMDVIMNDSKVKFAQFENALMMKGQTVVVGKFEDHDAHNIEHKKIAGNALIEPNIRAIVESHIEEHDAMKAVMHADQSTPLTGGDPSATLALEGTGGPFG